MLNKAHHQAFSIAHETVIIPIITSSVRAENDIAYALSVNTYRSRMCSKGRDVAIYVVVESIFCHI
jgi:hypothetical protein